MPRRNTDRKKTRFLEAIQRTLSVTDAADHAGVDRTTPYAWEAVDPAFAQAWAKVRDIRLRQLTDTAMDLALEGDGPLIRFLITRFDRAAASQEAQTIGEIAIIPFQEPDIDGPIPEFITIEASP